MVGKIDGDVLSADVLTAPQFVAECDELVFGTRHQQKIVPLCGEFARECLANSRRRASDEGGVHTKFVINRSHGTTAVSTAAYQIWDTKTVAQRDRVSREFRQYHWPAAPDLSRAFYGLPRD